MSNLGGFGMWSSGGGGGSAIPSEDMSYSVASGTNSYTVTLSPAITALTTGLFISVKFTNANTSSTVTLNPNTLGVTTVLNRNGGVPYIGQIQAGGVYNLVFDGTNLILQNDPYDGDISSYRKTGTTSYEAWYSSLTSNSLSTNNTTQIRDVLRLYPIIISKTTTFTKIGVKITVAGTAGSVMRLGIYRSSNNIPTDLVVDAGTVASDSTGLLSISVNVTLTAGLYFLAQNNNSAANITAVIATAAGVISPLGHSTTNSTSSYITYFTVAETYAPFTSDISGYSLTPQVTGHLLIYLYSA